MSVAVSGCVGLSWRNANASKHPNVHTMRLHYLVSKMKTLHYSHVTVESAREFKD